jgi:hypothetical protein
MMQKFPDSEVYEESYRHHYLLHTCNPDFEMKSLKNKKGLLDSRIPSAKMVERMTGRKSIDPESSSRSTIQFAELPTESISISPQQRIIELNNEIRHLTCELEYYKNLTDDVLLRIMPIILYHSKGLNSMVQKCHASIEQANSQRVEFKKQNG